MGRGLFGALEAGGLLLVAVLVFVFVKPMLGRLIRRQPPPPNAWETARLEDALPPPHRARRRQAKAYLKTLGGPDSETNRPATDRRENS